jgi:hypothetical protein
MNEQTFRRGEFFWRELMTSQPAAIEAFYGGLLGWTFGDSGMPGMKYLLASAGGTMVAGIMERPAEVPVSCWVSYVSVADVDAVLARAAAQGGRVLWGPADVPGVGRMATLADDQGAVFALFDSSSGDGPRAERAAHGEFCWETLSTHDAGRARAFYTSVLPWTQVDDGMPMYVAQGGPVADIESASPGQPASWLTHVAVTSLDESRAKVESLGGSIVLPERAIPGVGRLSLITDPDGALLSIFEASP